MPTLVANTSADVPSEMVVFAVLIVKEPVISRFKHTDSKHQANHTLGFRLIKMRYELTKKTALLFVVLESCLVIVRA